MILSFQHDLLRQQKAHQDIRIGIIIIATSAPLWVRCMKTTQVSSAVHIGYFTVNWNSMG